MPTNIKLNECSIELLKTLAEQLQKVVESTLGGIDSHNFTEPIKAQAKRLLCRAQEWKSNAFFVIVVGPVKSGKSTLVNLLAHEEVSPTHFLECTVRPSIISRKLDEKEVSTITPFVTAGDPTMDHVDSIIDYIKGLGFADLSHITMEEPCMLNKENLDKKVAYRIGWDLKVNGKVALASIAAKGGDFLQDNIYLIDMPGFDGVRANLDMSFYEAIVNRADLVVFVQSSNSAINKISEDFCTMIRKRNGSVPIYFVHNYFDSSYWHTAEERQKVTDGHIQKAMDFFKEQQLTVQPNDCLCINLGKVTDARNAEFLSDPSKCLPEYKDMLMDEESRFRSIEDVLHKRISASQSKTRLQNCINRTIREAEILYDLLCQRGEELRTLKQEYDRLNGLFDRLRAGTRQLDMATVWNADNQLPGLVAQLQDIQRQFCKNIDHGKKYNTNATREKARELIRMYKNSTESFVNGIFNPVQIQQDICLKCNSAFWAAIPDELKQNDTLFATTQLDKRTVELDFSSIDNKYDVDKQIGWVIFTRHGDKVIEHMIDIEHALFGLSPQNPCGFIPQQFFTALQREIAGFIETILKDYWEAFIEKVEKARKLVLAGIIPDIKAHEAEMQQIESSIAGVKGILNGMQQQNNPQ